MKSWELLLFNANIIGAVLGEAEPGLVQLGLEPKPFMLLASLDRYPHPAELAKALMLPNPTVSFLVKKAEASGFLKREPVAGDLRKFKLTLTESGRMAVEAATEIIDEKFSRRLSALSEVETASFVALLKKLSSETA